MNKIPDVLNDAPGESLTYASAGYDTRVLLEPEYDEEQENQKTAFQSPPFKKQCQNDAWTPKGTVIATNPMADVSAELSVSPDNRKGALASGLSGSRVEGMEGMEGILDISQNMADSPNSSELLKRILPPHTPGGRGYDADLSRNEPEASSKGHIPHSVYSDESGMNPRDYGESATPSSSKDFDWNVFDETQSVFNHDSIKRLNSEEVHDQIVVGKTKTQGSRRRSIGGMGSKSLWFNVIPPLVAYRICCVACGYDVFYLDAVLIVSVVAWLTTFCS